MRRRLFNVWMMLSLLLCIVVCGLWPGAGGYMLRANDGLRSLELHHWPKPGIWVQRESLVWSLPYWKLFVLSLVAPLWWLYGRGRARVTPRRAAGDQPAETPSAD